MGTRPLAARALLLLGAAAALCPGVAAAVSAAPEDPHSLANTSEYRVKHFDLMLTVDFPRRRLAGSVDLDVERLSASASELVLDTRDLDVREVTLLGQKPAIALKWRVGSSRPLLGAPLVVGVPRGAVGSDLRLRIAYATRPTAAALQWLTPAQTAGRTDPFLFTHSETIYARSWIPLQDTPRVRATFTARIQAPRGLRAVMGAENPAAPDAQGAYHFEMREPIPSYLMALAVGRLERRETGPRTAIYSEPPLIEAAANEFAETEKMIAACEAMYGPYRWGRYDLLILPPSFPYGGMENPRLSFITPTVIAGDRSLVSMIAHELAHSWSGNLVTNAGWGDFWLNEGVTTYLERRILEQIYGEPRRLMEDVLGQASLAGELKTLPPNLQLLAANLRGIDPEDATNDVPYEKGRLFLEWLESRFGRPAFDDFLRSWFADNAFHSVTTAQFRARLEAKLLPSKPGAATVAQLDEWLGAPGLPTYAVLAKSDAFTLVDTSRGLWLDGAARLDTLPTAKWSTFEWLHFIDGLPKGISRNRLAELDARFKLTAATNAEIACSWLQVAIRERYEPAYARLDQYLTSIGRRKLIRPLYEELVRTPEGRERALAIYTRARPGYHPIAIATIDAIVKPPHP